MTANPLEPLATASNWRAADLARSDDWTIALGAAEQDELDAALAHAVAKDRPMEAWTRDDFPLPRLGPSTDAWLDALQNGCYPLIQPMHFACQGLDSLCKML